MVLSPPLGVEGILYLPQISRPVYVHANMRRSKRTEFRVRAVNSMADSCRLHFLSLSFGRSNFSLNFPTFQCLMAISLAGEMLLLLLYMHVCVWQWGTHLLHPSTWKCHCCFVYAFLFISTQLRCANKTEIIIYTNRNRKFSAVAYIIPMVYTWIQMGSRNFFFPYALVQNKRQNKNNINKNNNDNDKKSFKDTTVHHILCLLKFCNHFHSPCSFFCYLPWKKKC